jgi:Protein of unknown function (DUF3128)
MGWLWSNGSNDKKGKAEPFTTEAHPTNHPPADASTTPPPGSKPPPRTREEQADAELQELIKELNYAPSDYPPESIPSASSASQPASRSANASSSGTGPLRPSTSSPIDPVRLLPTSMSCRAAFDQAYHCQLPGGQLGNVYRFGGMRNCSELWSNFWFCMRTNRGFMSEDERADRIRRHYWEREQKYREGPSSRDVWDMRGNLEEGAFQGNWADVDREMAEKWREREVERKKRETVNTGVDS